MGEQYCEFIFASVVVILFVALPVTMLGVVIFCLRVSVAMLRSLLRDVSGDETAMECGRCGRCWSIVETGAAAEPEADADASVDSVIVSLKWM